MDLAKFISMLTNQALYFQCVANFEDPYEGYLPRSHIEVFAKLSQTFLDAQLKDRARFKESIPNADFSKFNQSLEQYIQTVTNSLDAVKKKFGVNCWHESPHESEAMWKIYSKSGQGIAIESTIQQLQDSILDKKVRIDSVRYEDFDTSPIEKGHEQYLLFLKRKSFEHEKEVRAIIKLPEEGKGTLVKCDLNILINKIYISPLIEPHIKDDIEKLCQNYGTALNKPIERSPLFDKPNYGINTYFKLSETL